MRRKIAFVSVHQGSKPMPKECLQEQFLHSVLRSLKNENIPDELLKANLLKGEVINIKSLRR